MNRRHLLIALFALAIILGIGLSRLPRDEPMYEGRRLSSWLNDFPLGLGEKSFHEQAAFTAVVHIGTNAVPYLLESVCQRDTTLWHRARVIFEKRRPWNSPSPTEIRKFKSLSALDTLAEQHLLPAEQLFSVLERRDLDQRSATLIGHLLIRVDPANIRLLLELAHSTQSGKRVAALDALSLVGLGAPQEFELPVMMVLTNAISDPDGQVRAAAENALAGWKISIDSRH